MAGLRSTARRSVPCLTRKYFAHVMHLDEIYASEVKRDAANQTMSMMERLNRNKKVTIMKEKADEQRELDRKNAILARKIDLIDKGQYVDFALD